MTSTKTNHKPAKGSLSSSQLIVTSPHPNSLDKIFYVTYKCLDQIKLSKQGRKIMKQIKESFIKNLIAAFPIEQTKSSVIKTLKNVKNML